MFVVGGSHREFVIGGPAATTVVRMEEAASAGQIMISDDTASQLPARCARPAIRARPAALPVALAL